MHLFISFYTHHNHRLWLPWSCLIFKSVKWREKEREMLDPTYYLFLFFKRVNESYFKYKCQVILLLQWITYNTWTGRVCLGYSSPWPSMHDKWALYLSTTRIQRTLVCNGSSHSCEFPDVVIDLKSLTISTGEGSCRVSHVYQSGMSNRWLWLKWEGHTWI